MNDTRATVLQLCPLSAYLEAGVTQRFELIRWFDLSDAEQAAWLEERAHAVRAIVTGGHMAAATP